MLDMANLKAIQAGGHSRRTVLDSNPRRKAIEIQQLTQGEARDRQCQSPRQQNIAPGQKHRAATGGGRSPLSGRARFARRGTPPRIPAPPGMTQARHEAASAEAHEPLASCAMHRVGSTEFRYRIEDGEVTIVFCESEAKHLAVPETLGGAPVTAIDDNAFSDLAGISSATMPACLRTIGAQAFARCLNLHSIDVGQSLESIGEGAFRGCSHLTSLAFPETLSRIGSSALSNTAIARVDIPAACTGIDADALCTGPSFPGSIGLAYASSLTAITVSPGNPAYCMEGGVFAGSFRTGTSKPLFARVVPTASRFRTASNACSPRRSPEPAQSGIFTSANRPFSPTSALPFPTGRATG